MSSDSSQDGVTEARFTLLFEKAKNKYIVFLYKIVSLTLGNQATKDSDS